MTLAPEVGPPRFARALATVWLAVVLLILAHNVWLWEGHHIRLESDILALLPIDERAPIAEVATQRLTDTGARRIIVALGDPDWRTTEAASHALTDALRKARPDIDLDSGVAAGSVESAIQYYRPYRRALLTEADRNALRQTSTESLARTALASLYQPAALPRVGSWADDPANLFVHWLLERANETRARPIDGILSVEGKDRRFALVFLNQKSSAFSMDEGDSPVPALNKILDTLKSEYPHLSIEVAGVPLFAYAAARSARRDISTIGLGSLFGVVLLTLLAFRSIRPRILIALSIAIGCLAAISACQLIFGKIHLFTLVFGASLIGVAENYGTNYFASRQGRPLAERWQMLVTQRPLLWMAMATTAIGYLALGAVPFPGLRQMAVFSVVGLTASFVTVIWWFPLLDRGHVEETVVSRWIGSARNRWPLLGRNRFTAALVFLFVVTWALGAYRLRVDDDVRGLQNAPADLVASQRTVGTLLQLPGPAQFYLVEAASNEALLQSEEGLRARLDALRDDKLIEGVSSLSEWVPSLRRQAEDRELVEAKVFANDGVLDVASRLAGQTPTAPTAPPSAALEFTNWLQSPVSLAASYLYLGKISDPTRADARVASVVLLRGVSSPAVFAELSRVADGLEGVRWVDKVANISAIMERYRVRMSAVVAVSFLLVWAALAARFGRRAWRALAPTALASVTAIALEAIVGVPWQLFSTLALFIVLGMGVDYGIFMLDSPIWQVRRQFVSVTLGALSTVLSFGLLALSETPALRAFGLTMLCGIVLSWLLTPSFCPARAEGESVP